jgi:Protein of unknown function (DUF2735)
MTTEFNRETAKIYAFSKRPRATDGAKRNAATATTEVMPVRLVTTACGEAWYHEAALIDTEPARKR